MNKNFLMFGMMFLLGISFVMASPSSLVLTDLDDLSLAGLTVQSTSVDDLGPLVFEVYTYEDIFRVEGQEYIQLVDTVKLGTNWMNSDGVQGYIDGEISGSFPAVLGFLDDGVNVSIKDGDFVTLVFDGMSLNVYLPEVTGRMPSYFYIANDGATYYDPELTELASAKPFIIGPSVVELGTVHEYQIDIPTSSPDSDYSDGTYQVQFANYGLMDSNGVIITEGTWSQVFGEYQQTASIIFPNEVAELSLFAMITQIDMTFDQSTGLWTTGEEYVLEREAIKINVQYSVSEPENPNPTGFSFFSDLFNWLSGLWSWLF